MADDDCDLDTLLDVLDEEEEDEEDTTFAQVVSLLSFIF